MKNKIAEVLKKYRKMNNYSTEYVANELKQYGISIAGKTIYGYETGTSQPNADMFIALCRIYGIKDINVFYDSIDEDKQTHPIVKLFNTLNTLGKKKVVEYISDLKGGMNYTKEFQKYIEQTSNKEQ